MIAVWASGSGCQQSTEPEAEAGAIVFFSSFETDADTVGWRGYGGAGFELDAPAGGGARSLGVSGGCIIPHVARRIPAPALPCSLSLTFWGKNLALGGGISLRNVVRSGPDILVSVQDTTWTLYRADRSIACQPGDTLVLELNSGGIVYSAMRIDLLTVRIKE